MSRNREVWRIAAPMILSNVSVPLLGMVDTGVAGHLENAAYLAAVATGSALFGFLFVGFNFLRMGTTGVAAQQFGANDNDGLRTSLGQSGLTALAIATLLIILQKPIGELGLWLLGPGPDVAPLADHYFRVRIWGAPATLLNYALIGWFIGLQNARIPLLIVVATNAVNIVLDLLLVLVFGMTVDGIAMASVIAETCGAAIGLSFVFKVLRSRGGRWHTDMLFNPKSYSAFFSINANLFVRTIALVFTLSFITAQGARLGSLILAANAILMNLQMLLSFALDGVAHAAEALVGKAIGRRNREDLEASVQLTLRWSVAIAAAFAVLFVVAGKPLIDLLTDLPDVHRTATSYLPWMVVSPLISVWSFLYDGVFVGATRAREMRDIMLISALVVFLPSWFLLSPFGNHGLWAAFLVFMAARGIGMHVFYRYRLVPGLLPTEVR